MNSETNTCEWPLLDELAMTDETKIPSVWYS